MSAEGKGRCLIGIVGMGAAGQAFIPALLRQPHFEWVALAEPDQPLRDQLAQRHAVAGYASLEELLTHPGLDAVYLATPTALHAQQVVQAAGAGKHVLVEKPMAISLEEGRAMVAAADQAGVVLLVGHSHSYDPPIQRMRELIDTGELGAVRMVNTWCFTDWMYRPRRPDELDAKQGGGVTFRQGAHQFDVIRLLCGGNTRSVRAKTFDWNPARQGVGAHIAFLDFDNGAAATAVYNGYGGFSSVDLCFDISEWGFHQPAQHRQRAATPTALSDEQALAAKRARAGSAIPDGAPHQPFFGLTVVSCEGGDIRQSPNGLLVYTRDGQRQIDLPVGPGPRDQVLAEFHAAISGQAPARHDGRWGLANLALCVAAMLSSETGREIPIQDQAAS
jgi:phthalate 4,5-cis-dihydrodiol dehydrogenase